MNSGKYVFSQLMSILKEELDSHFTSITPVLITVRKPLVVIAQENIDY
jgi:hypothetical protein